MTQQHPNATALPRHGRDGVTDDGGRCEAAKPSSSSGSNPPVPVGEAAATNLKTVQALVDALMHADAGLKWYRDTHPEDTDGSDDEAAEMIDAAIASGRALIEQMKREQEAQPTSEAPAAKAVEEAGMAQARMLTSEEIDALVRDSAITEDSVRAIIKRTAYKVFEVNGIALRAAPKEQQ